MQMRYIFPYPLKSILLDFTNNRGLKKPAKLQSVKVGLPTRINQKSN